MSILFRDFLSESSTGIRMPRILADLTTKKEKNTSPKAQALKNFTSPKTQVRDTTQWQFNDIGIYQKLPQPSAGS
jgi:hypothetical protein